MKTHAIAPGAGLRYGGGSFDLRSLFLKLCGLLQGKKVVLLKSDPELCAEILSKSDTKGTFIENKIACPAWKPILSTESVDGELWKELAEKFKAALGKTRFRERLGPLTQSYLRQLREQVTERGAEIDAEVISRVTLRILYELLFQSPIREADETLFYLASMEWRKEIGMKGRANAEIKAQFWARLTELANSSVFRDEIQKEGEKPEIWLSAFAQPFLISPQINISDIIVAVFSYLRADEALLAKANAWAVVGDKPRLGGIIQEAIRLRHPFPILEREIQAGTQIGGEPINETTQFFLLFDQFKQDPKFNPERWVSNPSKNIYQAIPFGTGPRMCVGKPIAMELLVELLRSLLLDFPLEKVQPQKGHQYSGRNNDQQTGFRETLYQLRTILKAVFKSAKQPVHAEITEKKKCPFRGVS